MNPRFKPAWILTFLLAGLLTAVAFSLPIAKPLDPQSGMTADLSHYLNEGYRAYANQDWGSAIDNFQKALKMGPEQDKVQILLGSAYFNAGWPGEAMMQWKEALQKVEKQGNPATLAEIHYNLGEAYEQLSKPSDAVSEFNQAIHYYQTIPPMDKEALHDAYYNLGIVYGELHQWEEASVAFERMIAIDGSQFEDWDTLTIAYGAAGKLDKALNAALHAQSLEPESGESHYLLGLIHCLKHEKTLVAEERETLKRLGQSTARLDEAIRKACPN